MTSIVAVNPRFRAFSVAHAIGNHVPGIRHQGQRPGAPAGDEFDDRKTERQDQGSAQGVPHRTVTMAVFVRVMAGTHGFVRKMRLTTIPWQS